MSEATTTDKCGYGRYKNDPSWVGCPRARSDMTPCIARDGSLALADDGLCVGCHAQPLALLTELAEAQSRQPESLQVVDAEANELQRLVREVTEPSPPSLPPRQDGEPG